MLSTTALLSFKNERLVVKANVSQLVPTVEGDVVSELCFGEKHEEKAMARDADGAIRRVADKHLAALDDVEKGHLHTPSSDEIISD